MQELMGLDPLEVMNQWLTGAGREGGLTFVPSFEVKETKDAFIFKADLPGVDEKDLEITLTGDRITVSGKRETEKREESDRFYAYERSYGSFSRAFTLPEGVNADNVDAELKNGVLTIKLPKRPEVQPRRITVGSSTGEKKDQVKA
jgi:HSP20 family protein